MSSFREKPDATNIDKFFPNFSPFERAVSYPYPAPDYSFSFYKGAFVKDICHKLDNRIPILSVGSNRSPYQLKRKFTLNEDISVTTATLYDSDIVYSASISAYGSVPATQWPCEGVAVNLNVLWLKEDQLNKMHLTEGLFRHCKGRFSRRRRAHALSLDPQDLCAGRGNPPVRVPRLFARRPGRTSLGNDRWRATAQQRPHAR